MLLHFRKQGASVSHDALAQEDIADSDEWPG